MTSKTPINRSTVVASVPGAAERVCAELLSQLKANDFSREDIFAVHLALKEAFINAVNHGNKMDPNKEIKIDYSIDLDKIEVSMTDEGDGFDPDSVPDPRCKENLYKTKGRGLLLIRSYMDMVEFNEGGNHVHMVKHKSNVETIARNQ